MKIEKEGSGAGTWQKAFADQVAEHKKRDPEGRAELVAACRRLLGEE